MDQEADWATLALRPLSVADTDRVHEWASQERACRFQAWGPNTHEETSVFVAEAAATWLDPDPPRRVFAAAVDGRGVVGSGEILRVSGTCREIGYAVHPDYWGRGLGTRIAGALISTAFDEPLVERVQATCDPRNEASCAVLRRSGMSVEGSLRHTILLRDGWRDSLMHSILRAEWSPTR